MADGCLKETLQQGVLCSCRKALIVPYSDYLRRSPDAVKRNPGLAFPDSTVLHPGYMVCLE